MPACRSDRRYDNAMPAPQDRYAPPFGPDVTIPNPIVEQLKKEVDLTLLEENLKLTPGERLEKLQRFVQAAGVLRDAMRKAVAPE